MTTTTTTTVCPADMLGSLNQQERHHFTLTVRERLTARAAKGSTTP